MRVFTSGTEKLLGTLKEIGLTHHEAMVYISLLTVGQNPASVIARKGNIHRSSCHELLKKLTRKGFAREIIKNNISYYSAVDLKVVLHELEEKRYQIDEKITNISGILAQFEIIQNEQKGKPRAVFFEGEAGVKNIMEDTLTSREEIRAYASFRELMNMLPNYFQNYFKRRVQKGIPVRAIYPADPASIEHKKLDPLELRQSRLIPKAFDFHLDILIYENKVAITSLKEKFGVLIESREIAEAQKRIFDFIWEGTKKYDEMMMKKLTSSKPL